MKVRRYHIGDCVHRCLLVSPVMLQAAGSSETSHTSTVSHGVTCRKMAILTLYTTYDGNETRLVAQWCVVSIKTTSQVLAA